MGYKKITTSVLLLVLLTLALPVSAHGEEANVGASLRASTSIKTRMEVRADIEARRASSTEHRKDRREEIKNNIAERKASSTERRVDIQINLAKRKVEFVKRVILATIERLEKIMARIESRIVKVEERGGDTNEAKGFIALALDNLVDARVAVDAFVNLDLSSDKARENFELVRAAAAEAREHIHAARENLLKAIRSLRSVEVSAQVEGSLDTQ